ncbi:MAG: site-specific integrase [Succiniclasticum sp.]|nr:site-specific integrase [Succiniclasticum sp.]
MKAWTKGGFYHDKAQDRWVWRIRYVDENGIKQRKQIVAKTKSALVVKVDAWQAELEKAARKKEDKGETSLCEFAKNWLESMKLSVKPRTYTYYSQLVNNYIVPKYGDVPLNKIDADDVQRWLNALVGKKTKHTDSLSVKTVNKIRTVFITIMKSACAKSYISGNVLLASRAIRQQRKERVVLTEEQAKHLLEVARKGEYIYVDVKQRQTERKEQIYIRHLVNMALVSDFNSGLRIGELFALTWGNVDFANNQIRVVATLGLDGSLDTPKTKSSIRNVTLPEAVMKMLLDWQEEQKLFAKRFAGLFLNDEDLVFANAWGNSVSLTNFRRRHWHKLLLAAGLPEDITFHAIRHTHATLLLRRGVNVKVVSERLDHASTSITMDVYAHALPDMQAQAVKALNDMF